MIVTCEMQAVLASVNAPDCLRPDMVSRKPLAAGFLRENVPGVTGG